MRPKAEDVLRKEKLRVLKAVATPRSKQRKVKSVQSRVNSAINDKAWEPYYQELYSKVIEEFGAQLLSDYEGENEAGGEAWYKKALLFALPFIVTRIKEVVTTSRDRVNSVIDMIEKENGSLTELVLAINELYNHDIPIRTKVITATEVIAAGNIGLRYAVKTLSQNIKKQWIAVMDDRTRASHWNTDGEVREIDEQYSNGLMFPGDPSGPAEEVCNCRCIESYII